MKRSELQSNLAMTMLLLSGAMLFATLFMGYAIYRTSANVWPPLGIPKVSLAIPFLSTIIIALSSWFAMSVRTKIKEGKFREAHFFLNLTLLTGFLFLLSQSYLWFHLKDSGVFVGTSGIFGSILYGFTWIHAAHMLLGLGGLCYLKFVLKPEARDILVKATNVEKFWHFLGLIWFIMFITLFVL